MESMTGLEFPAQILAQQLGNGDRTNPPDAESILSIFILFIKTVTILFSVV